MFPALPEEIREKPSKFQVSIYYEGVQHSGKHYKCFHDAFKPSSAIGCKQYGFLRDWRLYLKIKSSKE